jgi:polyisoprenyl-phosphate glycosyltransferase
MSHPSPAIAVVMPVFNEEAVLPQTFARLTALFEKNPGVQWRAVLVNDGSKDRTPELLLAQEKKDPRFEVVEFTRNFGFQAALAAGIAHASNADAIVTMDADLQDPPELIPELIEQWRNGAEVVLAVRRTRQETGIRRAGMDLFHGMFSKLTDVPLIQNNAGTFGLISREAAEAFGRLPERHRFYPGLRAWIGFRVAEVPYDREQRAAGEPQQSFRRLTRYALDGLFSFSYLPLRLLVYAGIVIAAVGFVLAIFFAVRRILGIEVAETGFTTLVILVLLLGGGQLVGIGVLGEYLGRIYDEVKQRPLYVVKRRDPDRRR